MEKIFRYFFGIIAIFVGLLSLLYYDDFDGGRLWAGMPRVVIWWLAAMYLGIVSLSFRKVKPPSMSKYVILLHAICAFIFLILFGSWMSISGLTPFFGTQWNLNMTILFNSAETKTRFNAMAVSMGVSVLMLIAYLCVKRGKASNSINGSLRR